jgi:hypothetical protein
MNEIEKVLSLFKTAEDWNSFVELSNMKDMMVRELKCRLLTEMRKIAVPKLSGADWEYDANCDYISIVLHGHHTLKLGIEWKFWTCPWYERGAGIWINPSEIAPEDFIGKVYGNTKLKDFLTDNGFHESREHLWYPFVKTIPATVFHDGNNDSCKLVEECLFRAKQDAKGLADNLWKKVFKPFVENKNVISMLVESLQ